MSKLVSVIVPVYNVEKYIDECIVSILGQTYNNIEIILVDDGSTDLSGKICDRYMEKDKRINVIHKKNGGLSDARNTGIEAAKGEYISFIDSDDYVSPVFIEVLVEKLEKYQADIVAIKGGTDFWDGTTAPALSCSTVIKKDKVMSGKEALELMLYHRIATGAPFKLYLKRLFTNVRFPKGYLYEDVATTYKTFIATERAVIIDVDLYAYRKRTDSIIRQSFNKDKLICLPIAKQVMDDIINYDAALLPAAISRVYSMVYSVFLQVPESNKEEMIELWNFIKQYRFQIIVNNNKLMRKKNRYGAIVSYLGMRCAYRFGRKLGQWGTMK